MNLLEFIDNHKNEVVQLTAEHLVLVEKAFRLHDDRTLHVGGEQLQFKAGDCIHMNHSGKFERGTFLSLLSGAGFELIDEYLSEDRRFLMVAARPGP